MERLLILGQDLIDLGLVNKPFNIDERKTFKRDKLISNDFDFECYNRDNFFSVDNPKSLFYGAPWMYTSVKYYNTDDILIWDGVLKNIRINHRTKIVTLETKDRLFQFRDNYIEYQSADWETAATAAKNIMDNYSFAAYNLKTIQDSINYLDDNAIYLKCNFNMSDNINLYNALEKLAEVVGADCYSSLGNVYFKLWRPYTGGATVYFNSDKNSRLKSNPIINFLENEVVNNYSVDYDGSGGTPVTDATGNNIGLVSRNKYGNRQLEPLQTGTGKQIVLKDIAAAKFCGEQYINRSHKNLSTNPQPLKSIQFDVDIKFRQYINLESYFHLTFPEENWDEKLFEVFEFRRNEDTQNINILAYEVI